MACFVKNAPLSLVPVATTSKKSLLETLGGRGFLVNQGFERMFLRFEQAYPKLARNFCLSVLANFAQEIRSLNDFGQQVYLDFDRIKEDSQIETLMAQVTYIYKYAICADLQNKINPFKKSNVKLQGDYLESGFLAQIMFERFLTNLENYFLDYINELER